MKIKIDDIIPCECENCDEYTVIFSISGNKYTAFGFNIDNNVGDIIDADFSHIDGNISWEEQFNKNNDKKKMLIHTGNWSYDGFGHIVSINPVIADFGDIRLELGNFTHDPNVIGEYIYERIERLDIIPK